MSDITVVGTIRSREISESTGARGAAFDGDYLVETARVHEQAGYDAALYGYFSTDAESTLCAAWAAAATEKLRILVAHRPGFVAPTLAARKFATLDQLSGGRIGVHVITGGSDAEQQRDGDFLTHDARYARTDEYLDLVRRVWAAETPFDFEGSHYKAKQAYSSIRPVAGNAMPLSFGGASDAAVRVSGRHADLFALYGEPLDMAGEIFGRVRAAARANDRSLRLAMSFKVILGDTEAEAWDRAGRILADITRIRDEGDTASADRKRIAWDAKRENVGSERLWQAGRRGDVLDRCLWMGISNAIGATVNRTALVGTPETVALAMEDYMRLGVDTFFVGGFELLPDAREIGQKLLPLLRERAAAIEIAPMG